MALRELFVTKGCPHCREMREWLEFKNADFIEYDVEEDRAALARMRALANGQRTVPILVEDGKVVQVGWQGHGCIVSAE
ncbi:MAG TPA: Uxx-star family glutaredoxin-like (seleno)protein [Candidatus Acidoferrales bacterium]